MESVKQINAWSHIALLGTFLCTVNPNVLSAQEQNIYIPSAKWISVLLDASADLTVSGLKIMNDYRLIKVSEIMRKYRPLDLRINQIVSKLEENSICSQSDIKFMYRFRKEIDKLTTRIIRIKGRNLNGRLGIAIGEFERAQNLATLSIYTMKQVCK